MPWTGSVNKAMPWANHLPTTETEGSIRLSRISNRTFAFKPGDRLVFLTDKLLDPRVVSAISGLALAEGIRPVVVEMPTTNMMEIPAEVKPILEQAQDIRRIHVVLFRVASRSHRVAT